LRLPLAGLLIIKIQEANYLASWYRTICPRSTDPFYIVTYYIKWVTTFSSSDQENSLIIYGHSHGLPLCPVYLNWSFVRWLREFWSSYFFILWLIDCELKKLLKEFSYIRIVDGVLSNLPKGKRVKNKWKFSIKNLRKKYLLYKFKLLLILVFLVHYYIKIC